MANMLKVVLKNLFNKPATRLYPTVPRIPFERTRGRIYFDDENCIYCGICARKCPADAITVTRASNTWELNAFRCIVCGECVNDCPKKCITLNNELRHSSSAKKTVVITKNQTTSSEKAE